MNTTRRDFLKTTMAGAAVAAAANIIPGFSNRSYAAVAGANQRIKVAMMGVNGRGGALAGSFASLKDVEIAYVCDVDSRATEKCIAHLEKKFEAHPKAVTDFRKALEDKELDALVVAAPDHWHAPAAILACKAGKHVYLEKPSSHNPHEGELVVAASEKYKKIIQMGNQRRSWPNVVAAIEELKNGTIGRPYFAKGWYTSNRASIGKGKEVPVPEWLDYDLWQGPAPRRPYKDNVVHYNWHWFWNWGTGEALNNGTHMVDLMRWGLGVEYPVRVTSAGGRYRYQDDWETPDTQVITMEFANNTSMTWEGRSCNGHNIEGTAVGALFHGDTGSLMINGNAYTVYDLKSKVVKEVKAGKAIDARDTVNPSANLDTIHIQNFLDGIRNGTKLNADILGGQQSTLLCQLGNIALRCGNTLNIDPANGRIKNDEAAMKFWKRDYQPGWEPVI
ncbi:MAG: dehydrogenase [Lentisphaerae bacterium RIFOXYA12_FULL_48_11]|nr:MAG: dehydrogenase [Lentisphaerae bacterium RIFOXYA12_FULL_48_11]